MAQTWQPNAGDDYYDIPQILKRLEWLDAERRKDKDAIFLLQEQITQLKSENLALKSDIKELQKEISVYPGVFPNMSGSFPPARKQGGDSTCTLTNDRVRHALPWT